jgi:hypothetical protein
MFASPKLATPYSSKYGVFYVGLTENKKPENEDCY